MSNESGMDAASNLSKGGKQCTVVSSTAYVPVVVVVLWGVCVLLGSD